VWRGTATCRIGPTYLETFWTEVDAEPLTFLGLAEVEYLLPNVYRLDPGTVPMLDDVLPLYDPTREVVLVVSSTRGKPEMAAVWDLQPPPPFAPPFEPFAEN